MYIIVVGLGKVGQMVTKYLSDEEHDIVVIDRSHQKIEDVVNQYDVLGLCGNGASHDILLEAEANKADVIISVTTSDETNILVGMIAKKLGTKHTIARVRNPDYSKQKDFFKDELGFSMIINPELETANEIRRMILFSSAVRIDTFAKGKVELVELKMSSKIKLIGLSLANLSSITKAQVLICAVKRDDEVIVPKGDFEILENDHIYVTGSHRDLSHFCMDVGIITHKIKNVMIVGGSKIAFYLARQLAVQGIPTKIVERNHERCVELSKLLPYSIIIESDGSDEEIMLEEGIENSDALVCLTGLDEENIIMSLTSKQLGVRKTIAKVNRTGLLNVAERLNVDNVVSPKLIAADQIVGYLRAKDSPDECSGVQTLYKLVNDEVEALEFIVTKNTKHLNQPLKDIRLRNNILIAGILRNNEMIVPKGNDILEVDDRIIIVNTQSQLCQLNDIFEA